MSRAYDITAYNQKRDFKKTKEPRGARKKGGTYPRFCIQKHDASQLHYDFRLEVDGVLKSWAVPKGPSTDTQQKRLAIRVEDHPLDYIDFEGTIPEGSYGAGTVQVWDIGTYENITVKEGKVRSMKDSLKKGHFMVKMNGSKLQGGYAMTRIDEKKGHWLLVKMDDEYANANNEIISIKPESAITGRTIEEIEADAK